MTQELHISGAPPWLLEAILSKKPRDSGEQATGGRGADPADVERRAMAYARRCPPSISGSGGHNQAFITVLKVVNGFNLDEDSAMRVLSEWNHACQPPWSAKELRHKIREAIKAAGGDRGRMLDEDRRVRPREEGAAEEGFRLGLMTSAELHDGDFKIEFMIDDIMVKGQPMIVAGVQKTLKTSILIDLVLSLGTGSPFLGQFEVLEQATTIMISSESGIATLQETAKRVSASKGIDLREARVYWGSKLPQFSIESHMDEVAREIDKVGAGCCVFDPTYLAMLGIDSNAANMFAVGKVLAGVGKIIERTGCTVIMANHARKIAGNAPLELQDIAYAGFAEWARQWLLLARREKYQPNSGSHAMWATVGGSAGHNSLWALQIEEGDRKDEGGRRWDVAIEHGVVMAESGRAERRDEPSIEDFVGMYFDEPEGTPTQFAKTKAIGDGMKAAVFDRLLAAARGAVLLWQRSSNGQGGFTADKSKRELNDREIAELITDEMSGREIAKKFHVSKARAARIKEARDTL